MFNSLMKKILFTVIFISTICTISFAILAAYQLQEGISSQMESDGRAIVLSISRELNSMKTNNPKEIKDVLNSIQTGSNGNIVFLSITDNNSKIIISTSNFHEVKGNNTVDAVSSASTSESQVRVTSSTTDFISKSNTREKVYYVSVPFTAQPDFAMLNVGISLSGMNSKMQNTIIRIILISFIIMVLSILVGFIISRSLTKPIKGIVTLIHELSCGHLDKRLIVNSKDEIGIMATAINGFADDLQNNVVSIMKKISEGDLNSHIIIKDDKDEISPALQNTIESLRELIEETIMLSNSAIDGNLKTRGEADKFKGAYREIVTGINKTLDAVTEPINESSSVLLEIAKGNFGINVQGDYSGDHAEIKDAVNLTINTMRTYIFEISQILNKMADGNLDTRIEHDYMGEFTQIKNSLNLIINSFNELLSDIQSAADQVASSSKHLAMSSQVLSQGTTHQANAIDEITVSINEIASQTSKNALHASEANKLSIEVMENADLGNNQILNLLDSMQKINDSSSNISKIIKVIDDIAFQTNILALNAAVEAARAGQYGRGFAVVAEEVRNLASRCSEAAKETTILIESSINNANSGTRIANETAQAFNKIMQGILKTTKLVGDIASASNQQASSLAQINTDITEVSKVVQANSATSEESAAASQQLSSQSDLLDDLVSHFKLKKPSNFEYQISEDIEISTDLVAEKIP